MNHALVLACGNTLRGDDGVAVHIAHDLRAGFCDSHTDLRSTVQWTPELAEPISESDLVIFVDASSLLPPGEIRVELICPLALASSTSTHSISPGALLALARQLYGKTPDRAFLITIGAESFDLSNQLSEPVRRAIPAALAQIKALLSGISFPTGFARAQSSS